MRSLLVIVLISVALVGNAQKIEKYFDYQWHECDPSAARFYGVIIKTDSGWHRQDYFVHDFILQTDGTYEDSACKIPNGTFYYFYADKKLSIAGHYVHGKRQGLCRSFNPNGVISDSAFYENDHPVGISMGWHPNGYPSDSAVWQKDGSGVKVSWFDNGNPSSAGRFIDWNKPNGKWKFFHNNGQASAVELYSNGILTEKQYFNEDGNPADTTNRDRQAEFPGGPEAWQNYLAKHLFFPPQYRITNADKAVDVISFTIDENGKVQDVYVKTPFSSEFDKMALNIIKHSPVWKPAISHNRRVKQFQNQPVIFSQEEE